MQVHPHPGGLRDQLNLDHTNPTLETLPDPSTDTPASSARTVTSLERSAFDIIDSLLQLILGGQRGRIVIFKSLGPGFAGVHHSGFEMHRTDANSRMVGST